jgi:hypothetical protein
VLVLRPGGLVGGRELSWWDPRGLVGSRRRDAPERALQG